jgi:lipid-A-disaccharide synthase
MAVILPFEEPLWRSAGVDAHYVGHPAREVAAFDRAKARSTLGLTSLAAAVAILPGSRPHEVRRLLVPMLDGYEMVREERASIDARVLLAVSLDPDTLAFARSTCASRRVRAVDVSAAAGAVELLRGFDVAICASGTAALEAALARAVPVVAYRVGLMTELAARALVRTERIALPNVLLGRTAFTELVQRQACAQRIAEALSDALDHGPDLRRACDEVEATLGDACTPSKQVATMLAPWLRATVRG